MHEIHANYSNKVWYNPHPNNFVMNNVMEIWMKNHLVGDDIWSTVNFNSQILLKGMTNNVRLIFSVGDTTLGFTICIE